jgi:hypothetical protein
MDTSAVIADPLLQQAGGLRAHSSDSRRTARVRFSSSGIRATVSRRGLVISFLDGARDPEQVKGARTVMSSTGYPKLIGCRGWVTLAVPAERTFLLQVGHPPDCRIGRLLVENQSVPNCRDPLARLPRRVRQVSLVSSRLFDERTATVLLVTGETIGVEAAVQEGLV